MLFNNSQKVLYNLKQELNIIDNMHRKLLEAIDRDNRTMISMKLPREERFLAQIELDLLAEVSSILDRRVELVEVRMVKEDEESAQRFGNSLREEIEKEIRAEYESKRDATSEQI